jgi:HEAT repeat protein
MNPDDGAPTTRPGADRRAAVAVAGHRGDVGTVRAAFDDPDEKVRAAAVRALVRLEAATGDDVRRATADPSPIVRRTICELAGSLPDAEFVSLLDDGVPAVVEAAAFAVGETADDAAVPRLIEIVTSHDDALCRESAVAALGAIGDPRGKVAVLQALSDTNYIRRRAVVALAAFSGDDVDAALEERRNDRDWQVRQAVEDVLDINRQIGN